MSEASVSGPHQLAKTAAAAAGISPDQANEAKAMSRVLKAKREAMIERGAMATGENDDSDDSNGAAEAAAFGAGAAAALFLLTQYR